MTCIADAYDMAQMGADCDDGACLECEFYGELTPDEQREQDWYAHGDYLGDIEREGG